MTDYRKRFVVSFMSMLGVILFIGFLAVDLFSIYNDYKTLGNTMRQVVEPWNDPGDIGSGQNGTLNNGDSPQAGDREIQPPEKPTGDPSVNDKNTADPPLTERNDRNPAEADGDEIDDKNGAREYGITTVFFNRTTGQITVLSTQSAVDSAEIEEIVPAVLSAEKPFGYLKAHHILYYTDSEESTSRIAFTSVSVFHAKAARITLIILAIYLGVLLLLLPICIRVSKTAAKPMEEAIEMERTFVANISHDLKTPISVILANNSILKALPETTTGQRPWLDSTDDAARNMLRMIEEMLTLSSLENVRTDKATERIDFSAVVLKSALQAESLAFEQGIAFKTDITPDLYIEAAPEYARQIVSILMDNAFKYEPEGGTVHIRLSTEKGSVVFSVHNQGSVIDANDLPHIFERFYRADKARDLKKGHGLGLAIAKQICDLIGADIRADSTAEKGTTFTVVIKKSVGTL